MKGILIIALGNPHYGRMAANLASSIRAMDDTINIHLAYNEQGAKHLTEQHKKLFTSMCVCPPEYYTKNGRRVYLKAKTYAYELSPFEETIMLDADMIWLNRSASAIFEELKDIDFTIQNRGYCDLSNEELDPHYSMWCNIKEVKAKYNATGRFYQLASEFIYFKKTEGNRKYFAFVKEVFDNPAVNAQVIVKGKKIAENFGGDVPDELAFNIASAVLHKYPHKENFVPVYWFAADGKKANPAELAKTHYGYSIGGNSLPTPVLDKYTGLCRYYAKHLGLPFHYSVQSKRHWSPERRKI